MAAGAAGGGGRTGAAAAAVGGGRLLRPDADEAEETGDMGAPPSELPLWPLHDDWA